MDNRVEILSRLLDEETEKHGATKYILAQTKNRADFWERAFQLAQSEADLYKIKVFAAETRS